MNKTLNDLPLKTRTEIVALLNARLVDAIDLYSQTKQAHWNVKGANFIALHGLFDDVAGHVLDAVDTIAERAVQLGGLADGTSQTVAKKSSLKPWPVATKGSAAYVKNLSAVLAQFGKKVREAIDAADKAGDKDTADLFTGVSRAVDKDLWFVESHLEK